MKKKRLTIFHLFRKEGFGIFLHPFSNRSNFIRLIEKNEITGLYAREPEIMTLTKLKNDLHKLIDISVASWASDKIFFHKFIVSSIIFLVSYFVLIFLIKEKLPISEIFIISISFSILAYIIQSKQMIKLNIAVQKTASLRKKIDKIHFVESKYLKIIEDELINNESSSVLKIIEKLIKQERYNFNADMEELRDFLSYLEKRLKSKELKQCEKLIKEYKSKGKKQEKIFSLCDYLKNKDIDLSLYAVYRKTKISVEKLK